MFIYNEREKVPKYANMNGLNLSRVCSTLRIVERLSASCYGCVLTSNLTNGRHKARKCRPISRYYSSDLKVRGLRSLEKYVDIRQGEILTAEMFEDKIFASKKPGRMKNSIFAVKKEYKDLPSETHLQTRNRNPRNMELLGYNKPRGYGTIQRRRNFWNRYIHLFPPNVLKNLLLHQECPSLYDTLICIV